MRSYKTLEEVQLIAWHHMINDAELQTYTVDEQGRYTYAYVNPKLAYKRALSKLSKDIEYISSAFFRTFAPSFENLAETFENFRNSLLESSLNPLLPDEKGLG